MTHNPTSHEELCALLQEAETDGLRPEVIERLKWFTHFTKHQSIQKTCDEFGIARSTFYRWFHRFDSEDLSTIVNQPKSALLKPSDSPSKSCHTCPLCIIRNFFTKRPRPNRVYTLLAFLLVNITVLMFIIPRNAVAATSTGIIGVVDSEPFITINDTSTTSDIELRFGTLIDERLTWDITNSRFTFSDDIQSIGNISASGTLTINGAAIFGSTVRLGGVTYTFPGSDGTDNYVLTTDGAGTLTWEEASGAADQNLFATIAVSGQSNVVVDGTTDTLTFAEGSNITITTNASTDTVTIAAADTNTNQLTTFTLSADGGSNQTISQGNTLEIAGGAEITTTASATDTVTIGITDDILDFTEFAEALTIDADTTVTFGSNDFNFNLTGTGDFDIQDGGTSVFFVDGENGRIGINTTTTETALEVVGQISGSTLTIDGAAVFGSTVSLGGVAYTFPSADGTNNYVLTTDGAGTLTWEEASGGGADQNLFATIAVSGQSNVVVDSTTDTLTFAEGSNITITTNASTDTVTIAAADTNTNQLTTFTLSADGGSNQTISQGNTLEIAGGAEITTTASATDTVTIGITDDILDFTELADSLTIDADTTLTFGSNDFVFNLTSTGDFEVQDGGTSVFFIDGENGRIGINTTTTETALEVVGQISGSTLTIDGAAVFGSTVSLGGVAYTFPSADGTNNYVLTTDGAGTLTWEEASGGGGGISYTDAASWFVNDEGDTMTGGLAIHASAGLASTGSIITEGNFTLNSDNGAKDAVLTFGNDAAAETITFSNTTENFVFSDDVHVTGKLSSSGALTIDGTAIFNQDSTTSNFRVESNNEANMLFVDGTNDKIGIGNSIPEVKLEVTGAMSGTSVYGADSLASSGTLKAEGIWSMGSAHGFELTIATGVITISKSYHIVDTQSDAATDDLDTINGGHSGDILVIRSTSPGRDVTVKDDTGNLQLAGDMVLNDNSDSIMLMYGYGANWFEISRSNNNGA